MSYQSEVLADSPILYLPLSETTGTTCANLGSLGSNATANGGTGSRNATSLTAITPGVSIVGSGGGRISHPDNAALDITADVTYECWAKFTNFTTYHCLISKQVGGYSFRVEQTTRKLQTLASFTGGGGTSTTAIPNDTNWHHLAFTRSGNTYTWYIDGAAAGTATSSQTISANAHPLFIGCDGNGGSQTEPLNGAIDEPAVYNTALSAARILAHYNAGAGIVTTTFVPQIQAVY